MRPEGRGELESLYFDYPIFDAPPASERGNDETHDVVIVGAGPVGLLAALVLARNGVKSLIVEKKNTFNDFIDVARWLINEKQWTTSDKLSCEGRSAGGLTIGASLNQAPELFRMAIMGVPFVDLMCTMVDASIPLTAGE